MPPTDPIPDNIDTGAHPAIAKACTQCGIDVSRRRRIKDRQGRYMCGHCHELFFGDPNRPASPESEAALDDTRIDEDGLPAMNNDSSTGTYPSRGMSEREGRRTTRAAGGFDSGSGTDSDFGTNSGTRGDTHPGVFTRRATPQRGIDRDGDELRDHLFHQDPDDSAIVEPDESADDLPIIGADRKDRTKASGREPKSARTPDNENLPRGRRIPLMEASYRRFAVMVGVQAMMHVALVGAALAGRGWVPIVVVSMVAASTVGACVLFSRICDRVDWEGAHRVLLPISFFVPVGGAVALVLAERRLRRRVVVRGGNPSILEMFGDDELEGTGA